MSATTTRQSASTWGYAPDGRRAESAVCECVCVYGLMAGAVVVFVLIVIGVVFLCVGYYYKVKREYKTYEGEDAHYFDSADIALAAAVDRQPEVQREKEYYI